MTRSTFCVPILAGRHPPTLSIPDDWEDSKFLQKANQLAQYYLTLHDPWNMDTLTPYTYSFDYSGFNKCVQITTLLGHLS